MRPVRVAKVGEGVAVVLGFGMIVERTNSIVEPCIVGWLDSIRMQGGCLGNLVL